ncbi:uncharacterized protein ATC70_008517 [Mucor velutinosus]|uniref:Uncharacterized protein n=1 Tax=Mucor velutinosus TaxID=708070 RepID=A0AAN7DNF8_9FUNG|nr:hypothetical protein ATC70_008517 [Mucor velutinosus]
MTAYQIPTENEQLIQWSNVELQPDCSRKRVRTFEQDESGDSATPPEKTIRLHESIVDGKLYSTKQWIQPANASQEIIAKEQDEQNSGKSIDISKLSTQEILSAYKRIWNNLDLSKPTDAKLEPFVWRQIRQYQQRL